MALLHPVKPGHKVRLADIDPDDCGDVSRTETAPDYEKLLDVHLPERQELLYAAASNSVLIVLQGIDTAGKDGTIKHVMARLNPSGVRVDSFKVPTALELAHDFLWRAHRVTPATGWIEIFNRSHYEDVLVTRVDKLVPKRVWKPRFEQINRFEELLAERGTIVLKFFLYISKQEQHDRLMAREKDVDKAWKLSPTDWVTYEKYDAYIDAYEEVLEKCSTEIAPWYIVPSNRKWFRDLAVAQTISDVLGGYEKTWNRKLKERGERILAEIAGQRRP
jgi:PPK2 family polyphosphate:nucleotide phosphotransferase